MAGARHGQLPRRGVEGHKQGRHQLAVLRLTESRRLTWARIQSGAGDERQGACGGTHRLGEARRRDALARDIADGGEHEPVGKFEDVMEVAADEFRSVGWRGVRGKLEPGDLGQGVDEPGE